jgi:RHS repeat-associated protein
MIAKAFNSNNYRYGFNGQEKDDEIAGSGNSYTAEYWQYDSRLGRRWNIDPVFKEHESPFATFANNPISFIDPFGADTITFTKSSWSGPAPKQNLDRAPLPAPGGSSFGIDVKPAEGPHVFYYTQSHTSYGEDGSETTTTSTTRFYPVEDHKNGLTETPYFLGLLSYKDNDRLTLAKLAPTELLDYLIENSSGWDRKAYKGAKALQSTYGVFEYAKLASEFTISLGGFSYPFRSFRGGSVAVQAELKFTQQQVWKKFGEHYKEFGLTHSKEGFQQYLKMAQEIHKNPTLRHTFPQGGHYAGETWMINNGTILRLDPSGNFRSMYIITP